MLKELNKYVDIIKRESLPETNYQYDLTTEDKSVN